MHKLATNSPTRAASLCVLLSPCAVRAALPGLDEDDVIRLAREHRLAPAFDVGLESRQLLRFAPSSIAHFQPGHSTRRRLTDAEMFAEILPSHPTRPILSGEDARLILNCAGGHINLLVDSGELAIKPGTARRRGPGGSDVILVPSFLDFLKRRKL